MYGYIIASRIYKRECNDVTEQYLCYAWIAVDCGRAHASLNIIPHPTGDYIDYGMIPPKRSLYNYIGPRLCICIFRGAHVCCMHVRRFGSFHGCMHFRKRIEIETERSRCILLICPEIDNPSETNSGVGLSKTDLLATREREKKIGIHPR